MTILITGALTGLGRALTQRLISERRRVRLLVRRPFSADEAFGGQAQCHEWHPVSEPLPNGVLEGVTTIVNLIGEPFDGRLTPTKRERLGLLRRSAADKLVGSFGAEGRRLILASTVAIYGDVTGKAYTEADPPGEPGSPLQKAAHEWESSARSGHASASQVAIARFGLIVGADRMLEELAEWIGLGTAPATGQAMVPLIDLEDAVALLVGLIDNPGITGSINAMAPDPIASADLIMAICDTLAVKPRIRLPAKATGRLLGVGAELLLRQSQIVPQRLIELGCAFTQPDPLVSIRQMAAAMKQRRAVRPSSLDRLRELYWAAASSGRLAAAVVSDRRGAARRGHD